ncbi:MAG: pirin family protein [Geminicoccaceae bacterium]
MSWQPCDEPGAMAPAPHAVETVIVPRVRDLGGFEVRRALPSPGRQMVGPFIFLDQMGPSEFVLGAGLDVRPHPHIGLATVTYLFQGRIMHRDSLGTVQPIEPGAVNWMTAGSGIAHSERTAQEDRQRPGALYGIQAWVALPSSAEETAPGFAHHEKASLPVIGGEGKDVRLIAGSLFGQRSPVPVFSETVYADASLQAGAVLPFPAEQEERAVYTVSGEIEIGGQTFGPAQLLILRPEDEITIRAMTASRFLLLGGAPMDGPRYVWWNFVSSRRDRIEAAKADWQAGRFDAVPGDMERIPLPGL